MNTNQVEATKAELTRRKIATWCGALDSMDAELGVIERQLRFATIDRSDSEKELVARTVGWLRASSVLVYTAKGALRDVLEAMLRKDAPVLTDADRKEAKEASER